jgi:alpha-mannosidase
MKKQIHLICNAHLDPVWLWEWQEGAAEALSTFRTAAELCEKNKTFVFNHNEVILYEWVREYEPSLFERIKKLVKKGQWHIMGGWYLQPDCNMPSGESFVRQILAGRRYFREQFGVAPTTAINFDPFGHSRGLVQILAKSGFDSYLFGRPGDQWMKMDNTPFVWVGFDGSKILGRRFAGWYNTLLGKSRMQIEERIAQSPHSQEAILWGVGNHGGGPSRRDLEDINALIQERSDVEILHSTPEAYFAQVKKHVDALPLRSTDLNPWAIGCYTSMTCIKQKHRQLENELYLTEKMASCAAANKLLNYPQNDLHEAGKDLMFSQFHDILPGSSIQPAEQTALQLMDHGLEVLSRIKTRCFFALTSGQKKAKEGTIPILVFNPHPCKVREAVECEFNLPDFNTDGSFMDVEVLQNGRPLPCQVEKEVSNMATDWRKRVVFKAPLKPGQMNRFDCRLHRLKRKPAIRASIQNQVIRFKTDSLHVLINTKTGLIDRYCVNRVDYVEKGAFCPVILSDNEDPWETRAVRFGKVIGRFKLLSREAGTKFSGIDKTVLNSVRIIEDGPVRMVVEAVFGFEESFICQHYKLPRFGSEMEVVTRVFWNQKNKMLKLQIPLAYTAERYLGQTAYGTQDLPINGNEAVAQKWVAAVSKRDGKSLTCINDGSYGSDCSGSEFRLSLLRAPAYSGHPVDRNEVLPLDRFTPRIDQGERLFRFWINAGPPKERLGSISSEALLKNEKPYPLSFFPKGNGKSPEPMVLLNNPAIELSAVKKAETNADWILRLFNTTDRKQSARVAMPALGCRHNAHLRPYEIQTLRVSRRKKIRQVNLVEEEM